MTKLIKKILIPYLILTLISCKKDTEIPKQVEKKKTDTLTIHPKDFLFNIPISGDTILMDSQFEIDFRTELEGYKIDSVKIFIDNNLTIKTEETIINSRSLFPNEGDHQIHFYFRAVNLISKDTVFFDSGTIPLKVIKNLSNRYINISDRDGKLHLSWPELDKKNTQYYLIEKYMGNSLEFMQEFNSNDSIFTDDYYVGEDALFKISVINNNGTRQNIWSYKKTMETPTFSVSQNSDSYTVKFSKCRYYNNLGQYYLTTGVNTSPELIFSSTIFTDTVYQDTKGIFGDEARYWIRFLPKEYPKGITSDNWQLYSHYLYAKFGDKSFTYNGIAKIDNTKLVYTQNGNIYKYSIETNKLMDSIEGGNKEYGFLRTTPSGKYIYANDTKTYNSPIYIWPSDILQQAPVYSVNNNFIIPHIADNLNTLIGTSDLSLYNIAQGTYLCSTGYRATSDRPKISSNGEFCFINNSELKLCSFQNNTFKVIWQESNWTKYYRFVDFNSSDNSICYVWDDNKKFSIKNTSDFSDINSYTLDLEEIVNIDYTSGKIMGYVTGKIMIYNLTDGSLLKEIPANLMNLFMSGNMTLLINNTIFNNNGIKYSF